MAEHFHRQGHHIQSAHGRRTFADDGSHLDGGMIALMPTAADAKRLAFPGGEAAGDLHCTLLFLGDDGSAWPPDTRDAMEAAARQLASSLPPIKAKIFGVAHWNGDGDKPSWVWSVGDNPDRGVADSSLEEARALVGDVIGMTMAATDGDMPEIPQQHSPWVAHICAAYSDDLTVVRALEKKLGEVTFDRIRLSFGDDDRDIPLAGKAVSLTASALRRDPHEHEVFTDFTAHGKAWDEAVATASARLLPELEGWRQQIHKQITAGVDTPEEMDQLKVDTGDAADILTSVMHGLARQAGDALVREARWQGVRVGPWELPDDVGEDEAVTAAVGGRRLLRSVAKVSTDLMATNLVQSARRAVTALLGRSGSPEQLADAVDERLQGAQDAAVRGPVGTAMSTAQTTGRTAVLRAAPAGDYYASEIMDRNTCGPCKEVDGEQFDSLDIAIKAYPVMGYKDCVGPQYGNACRGMIVARWRPEGAVTAAADAVPFHGTLGDPGYHKLHPGGKGKTKLESGVWVGSDDYSEDDHMDAFYNYTAGGFADMNNYLRTGKHSGTNPDLQAQVHALNDLIMIQPPPKGGKHLYRGMKTMPGGKRAFKVGDEFHDAGFVSTTSDESVARKGFSGAGGVIFEITTDSQTHALDGDALGGELGEFEWILPPGTKFRVRGTLVDAKKAKQIGVPQRYLLEVVHE